MKSPLMYLGTGLIIVLMTALIAPMLIDWSNYRADLERYGTEIAGREVRIDGPVRIQLLPSPVLRVNDVRIANVDGATAQDFIAAESLEVRLSLSPLLKGQVEVAAVELNRVTFEFERIKGAGSNWQLGRNSVLSRFLSAEDISLQTATIRDSVVVLRDGARGGVARLENVDMDVTAASLAGPYRIRGSFSHEDQPVSVSIATGRRSAQGEMRLSVNLTPDDEFMPNYGFDGRLVGLGREARLEGKLHIARDLPPAAENAVTPDPAKAGLPFSFKSQLQAGYSSIVFEDIELLVDQAQPGAGITGTVDIVLADTIDLSVDLVARHLDLDRVAQRAGFNSGDFVPGLHMMETIGRLLQSSPDKLRGSIRLDASALTMGGETIEAVEVRGELADRGLTFSRIGGVLPGRSSVAFAGLRYTARAGTPGFEGNIRFTSRDTNGFMHWALPGFKPWLRATTRGLKGASSLTGRVVVDGRRLAISGAELKLDDTIATGTMSFVPGKRPKVAADLTFDRIDFDRYLPPPARGHSDDEQSGDGAVTADPFSLLFTGFSPDAFNGFDGKLSIRTGPFKRWRRSGEALTAVVEAQNGELILHRVAVRNYHQLNLAFDGRVKWVGGRPQGRLTAKLNSPAPENLLDLERVRRLLPGDIATVQRTLEVMSPIAVQATLASVTDGAVTRTLAGVEGTGGGNKVSVNAEFTGDWDRFRFGAVTLTAAVSGARSDPLLMLAGGEPAADEIKPGQPGRAQLSLTGSLVDGMDAVLEAELYATRIKVHGLLSDVGGQLSAESEVDIGSDDATALYRALGAVPPGQRVAAPAINLKGLVSASEGDIVVTGLGGNIGGIPVGLDGTGNFTGERPRLFGNVTVAEFDLPWAVAQSLALPANPENTAASNGAWRAELFKLSALRAVDLNLVFHAGDVKLFGGATASRLQAEITIADGSITVERLKSNFANGELTVDARLDELNGQLAVEGTFDLRGAEFTSTLDAGNDNGPLGGRYGLAGTFKGSGRSPIGFVSSLSGHGALRIDKASLRGVNPGSFSDALREASTAGELDGLIRGVLIDGEMAFSGLRSAFVLENGIVRFTESQIEGPDATGRVTGYFDLPTWRMDSEWTISLKRHPNAPPLNVVLAGPVTEPVRSYDTKALRSFFVVKGLTEGVQRLERIQREEEARLRRMEELERKARIEEARRSEEQLSVPERDVFAPRPVDVVPDDDVEQPVVPDADLVARTRPVETPTPEVPAVQDENPQAPTITGTVAPRDPVAVAPDDATPQFQLQPGDTVLPTLPAQDQIKLDPLPAPLETVSGDDLPEGDDADEETENAGPPVNIVPPKRTQRKRFTEDPSNWRK